MDRQLWCNCSNIVWISDHRLFLSLYIFKIVVYLDIEKFEVSPLAETEVQ